jgi:hypothetical protein
MTRKTGCWRDATHPVKTQYVVPWADTSPIKSSVRSIFLNDKNRATAGKIETKQLVSKGIIDIRFPGRKKCKKRDFFYQGGKWGTVAQRGERDTTGVGTKKNPLPGHKSGQGKRRPETDDSKPAFSHKQSTARPESAVDAGWRFPYLGAVMTKPLNPTPWLFFLSWAVKTTR